MSCIDLSLQLLSRAVISMKNEGQVSPLKPRHYGAIEVFLLFTHMNPLGRIKSPQLCRANNPASATIYEPPIGRFLGKVNDL